jgi:hypothetical protein
MKHDAQIPQLARVICRVDLARIDSSPASFGWEHSDMKTTARIAAAGAHVSYFDAGKSESYYPARRHLF